jgi:hypothetical protein
MVAFEVYVNRVKVCTAGIEEFDGMMAFLLAKVQQDSPPGPPKVTFNVSASGAEAAYNWVQYELQVGNRVEIRIVNSSKTDKPRAMTCPGGSCAT